MTKGVQEGISIIPIYLQPSLSASLILSLSPETPVYPIDLKHAGFGAWQRGKTSLPILALLEWMRVIIIVDSTAFDI